MLGLHANMKYVKYDSMIDEASECQFIRGADIKFTYTLIQVT